MAECLRGQAYDGAGAMTGKSKGAASCIITKQPKALYTHCASHRLNLCIVKCCSILEISNMMESADKISHFFNNSPRLWSNGFMKFLHDMRREKVKDMCCTRCLERHEAFEVFIDLFMPITCCLEEIANSSPTDWNSETKSEFFSDHP